YTLSLHDALPICCETKTKGPARGLVVSKGMIPWRRGWDSNPRYGETVRLISSQVHSTTLPPLRCPLSLPDECNPAGTLPAAQGAVVVWQTYGPSAPKKRRPQLYQKKSWPVSAAGRAAGSACRPARPTPAWTLNEPPLSASQDTKPPTPRPAPCNARGGYT